MSEWRVRYSYLPQQFADPEPIFDDIRVLVQTGKYTLGQAVKTFEEKFAALIGTHFAIGVGSGTDALKLSLKAVGVEAGDEVITAANTFIASVGAIHELGAIPVFVDCNDHFCLDVEEVEAKITSKTKALLPVHFTGEAVDMSHLMAIAKSHGLAVVEDACQGILAEWHGKRVGTWGEAAGFSLHPLKNLNVWGDAGVIVTNDDKIDHELRLLRNHGLGGRDHVLTMGYNSRLDTLQAIVGLHLIDQTHEITNNRIRNAAYLDRGLAQIPQIVVPERRAHVRSVFHLYVVFAEQRDELYRYCRDHKVEAKIHYPIPVYAQPGLARFGYKAGDFPIADQQAARVISFPVDQHLSTEQLDIIIETVKGFYNG